MGSHCAVFLKCAAAGAAMTSALPAQADVSALYKTDFFPMSMTVEVDDTGDVRLQMSPGASYYLLNGGKAYIVQRGPAGPYAAELGAFYRIQIEGMSGFLETFKSVREKADFPESEIVPTGPAEVRGRKGVGYSFGFKSDKKPEAAETIEHPMIVISDDPQLALLGAGMAQFQRAGGQSMGSLIPQLASFSDSAAQAMSSGAMLRMGPFELVDVNMDSIDPTRFALPAEPLTEDQMRAMAAPFPSPLAFPDAGKATPVKEEGGGGAQSGG